MFASRSRPTSKTRPPCGGRAALALLPLLLAGCGSGGAEAISDADRVAYAVSTILIKIDETTTEPVARQRAWRLWDDLVGGADFAEVAEKSSQDRARALGGFVGFVPVGMETRLAGAIQAVPPGAISPPVQTSEGYQIFKRHGFADGAALESELLIPAYGFAITWGEERGAEGRTKAEARDLAERLVAQVRAGSITLAEARTQVFRGATPSGSTFIDNVPKSGVHRFMYEAMARVAPGEMTDAFQGPRGEYWVLRRGRPLRCIVRHILIQHRGIAIQSVRSQAQAREHAESVLKQVQADRAKWDLLVRNHSDDAATVADRGRLPIVGPGVMPVPVEEALLETAPGEIVDRVVESEHGFHVLWRVN